MAQNIQQHIFLPIPSLKSVPKDATREQKLRLTIANVEKNHKQVKYNIIAGAKSQLEQGQVSRDQPASLEPFQPDSDAMDISPTSSPNKTNPSTSHVLPAEALSQLLSNLRAPTPPPGTDPFQTRLPAPPPHLRQVTPPPNIQLAQRTLDAVNQYDKHSQKLTDFYAGALQRMTGRPAPRRSEGSGVYGQTPTYSPRAPPPPPGGRGPVNASPRTPKDAAPLDPRLVGRR